MTTSISGPIEVRGLTKHFAAGNGLVGRGKLHAVDDVTFTLAPRHGHRARRGERQRQEHGRAHARPPVRADQRQRLLRGQGRHERQSPPRRPALPVAGADDLPGSVRIAEPGQDDPPPSRATAEDPRPRVALADRRAHRRAADDGRARAAGPLRRQVPVRALGRPAAARRDRARARRRADRARGRRADVDARRLDSRRASST